MPTVLREAGFRVLVLFPPREHPPPHVHVVKGDGVAVMRLRAGTAAQLTHRVEGMTAADRRNAERIVRRHTEFLLREWRRIHGWKNQRAARDRSVVRRGGRAGCDGACWRLSRRRSHCPPE